MPGWTQLVPIAVYRQQRGPCEIGMYRFAWPRRAQAWAYQSQSRLLCMRARCQVEGWDSLLTQCCSCAEANIGKFTARNLANTLWGLAKISHSPGAQVLLALREESIKKIADFNAQNIANTLWAFASLGKAFRQAPVLYPKVPSCASLHSTLTTVVQSV